MTIQSGAKSVVILALLLLVPVPAAGQNQKVSALPNATVLSAGKTYFDQAGTPRTDTAIGFDPSVFAIHTGGTLSIDPAPAMVPSMSSTTTLQCPPSVTSSVYSIVPTANNQNIQIPSCPLITAPITVMFRVNQAFTGLTFGPSGIIWTGKSAYADAVGINEFGCLIWDPVGPEWDCWTAQYNMGAAVPQFVQGVLGVISSGSPPITSQGATGNVVGSGNCVVGAAMYSLGSGGTFSNITDDKASTYTVLDTGPGATNHYLTTFYRCNITNGPSTIYANFSSSPSPGAAYVQVMWLEYRSFDAGASVSAHAIHPQTNPGTAANAITSGTVTGAANSLIVGFNSDDSGTATQTAGTGFAIRKQDAAGGWGLTAEDKLGSTGSVAATFTDATNGGAQIYNTAVIVLIQ